MGKGASPTDTLPRLAGQSDGAEPSDPILQRRAVDLYQATSAVSQETNPLPAYTMVSSPAPERGLTNGNETADAASQKALPTLIVTIAADTAPTGATQLAPERDVQKINEVAAPDARPQLVRTRAGTSSPPSIKLSAAPIAATTGNAVPSSLGDATTSPETKSVGSVVKDIIIPAGISATQQQRGEASSPAVVPGKSNSVLPTPLVPASVPATATAASTGIPDAVGHPIASAPEAAVPSPQSAQDTLVGPSAPLPPWQTTSPAAPDKSKAIASTPGGNDIRSAARRAAQAQVQLVPESPAINKVLHPAAPEATPGSKDNGEKKAAVSSSPDTAPAHETPTQAPLMRDGAAAVVPHQAAPAAPMHAMSPETHEAPPAPQLPDATPSTGNTQPGLRVTTDAGGDLQMHVGIRTAAFGAVEIYTSVHQNQVGVTVQGERGMAHWFVSEVQDIASGLKDHHLHLTMTEMDRGSTGLQTSTGSQQQQNPQRNFPALRGWQNQRTPEREKIERIETVPARLPAWSEENQFSIHV